MMEQEYRREMDRVELSPDQRAHIVQAMVEELGRKDSVHEEAAHV